jgi:hypothetical protein
MTRRVVAYGDKQKNTALISRNVALNRLRLYALVKSTSERIRPHIFPLLVVASALVIGQIAVFVPPIANFEYDTRSYITAAWNIAQTPTGLIQSFRMPGYPLFIFLVLAVQGAPHYSELVHCWRTGMEGICTQQLNSIVYAQAVIAVIAALECYILVWRLSHRRGVAALATSLIALNILFGNWERLILAEFLGYWAILTVFLAFERLVRRPSILRSCIFALTCLVAIAIRPFNVYLPVVLLLLLGGWYVWTHQLKARLAAVLSAIAVLSVCALGYMALNAHYNNYFGLTWETDITLFGKVVEYHMVYYSVPPQYQDLQTFVDAWFANQRIPFSVLSGCNYDLHACETASTLPGSYARYVISHHLPTFVQRSLPDLLQEWINPGNMYSHYDSPLAWWVILLLVLSIVESYCYVFLPLFMALSAWHLRRWPGNREHFVMLCMGVAAIGAICTGALGNYSEFYRTRFPIDWALIALTCIWLVKLATYATRRIKRGRPATMVPVVDGVSPVES